MRLSLLLEGTSVQLKKTEQMDSDSPLTLWIDVKGKDGWTTYRYEHVLWDDYQDFKKVVPFGDGFKALNKLKRSYRGIKE